MMIVNIKVLQSAMWLVLACTMLFSTNSTAGVTDKAVIEKTLKMQWDKPGHPLDVLVTVIRGDYAIADWAQKPRGGRALLIRNANAWQTLLCGDVNLTKKMQLVQAGVPSADADYLSAALAQAELHLTEEDKVLVNSFKGVVDLLKVPEHHGH